MIALVALWLATAFPSQSKTTWMRPQSFQLTIGMKRAETMKVLQAKGWKPKKGDKPGELVLDYADDKTLTMVFGGDRLESIRFELFTILHDAHGAFDEEKTYLRAALGPPKKLKSPSVLLYDNKLPNIMVVLTADPKSEQGQKGVGMLVVRYFDPVVKR
ncbi:MAG: hypothetical protein ABIP63_03735 [Thermoanaerobaculia bacterium]